MSRKYGLGLVVAMLAAVGAHADDALVVSADELGRLGVALERGEPVNQVEVAAGPATVVVPAAQEAIVSAPTAGLVTRLRVAEGEPVVGGQALAEIRSPEYLTLQREYLDARGAEDLALAQLARDRALHAEGIIADRRLEETVAAERAAATRLAEADQQLSLAGMRDAEIATLATTRRLSADLVLRAPFAGVVTAQLVTLGAQVEPLAPVHRIADLGRLWLEMHLAPERVAHVKAGMTVAVQVGERELVGEVLRVSQIVNPAAQTVLVRAVIDNPDLALRAGQILPAKIRAASPEAGGVIALPMAAVARSGEQSYVFVRTSDGVAARVVEPLAADGTRVYVAGGIDAETELAVRGISALKSLWLASLEEGG